MITLTRETAILPNKSDLIYS